MSWFFGNKIDCLSEVLCSEFQFCFQKMLRQAGIAKGMATVPLCFIKKRKNIKELFANYEKEYKTQEMDWGEPEGKEIW